MTLRLLPERRPRDASEELNSQTTAIDNVRTAGHTSEDLLREYLAWAIGAERMLRTHFAGASVTSLLFTRRYWAIQNSGTQDWGMIRPLVEAEIAEQSDRLVAEKALLDQATNRWLWGNHLLVLDTSAIIHGPPLWLWDPAVELGLSDESIQIVLPMLVLDELDDLKESGKQHTRTRARRTLKWVSEQLGSRDNITLREERAADESDGSVARGVVYLDVLIDEAGHSRLPIADDEIVDRAASVATVSGRTVTLITNDVGQRYRAHLAGLNVAAVLQPVYDVDIQEGAKLAREEQKVRVDAERRAAQEAQKGKRRAAKQDSSHPVADSVPD